MLSSLTDFYNLSVSSYMSTDLVFVSPYDTVKKASQLMTQKDIGALVVLDMENNAAIVTERDIVCEICEIGLEDKTPISEIMTVVPVKIDVKEKLGVACQLMVVHGFRHLLIEDKGEVIGIISIRDIARAIIENTPTSCLRKTRKKR